MLRQMTEADQRRLLFKAQQRVEDAKDGEGGEDGEEDEGSKVGPSLSLMLIVAGLWGCCV